MVTEVDVAISTNGGYLVDSEELQKQDLIYRFLLNINQCSLGVSLIAIQLAFC
jgi:hypothetical protein